MRIEAEILNELGLHARPAAEFVRAVHKFKSTVNIIKGDEVFSGGSILEVLSANLDCGTRIIIEAEGPDCEAALAKMQALLEDFRDQENAERKKK
jgi:phosphocarrier protein HPr